MKDQGSGKNLSLRERSRAVERVRENCLGFSLIRNDRQLLRLAFLIDSAQRALTGRFPPTSPGGRGFSSLPAQWFLPTFF
jgi:hypothetical protein